VDDAPQALDCWDSLFPAFEGGVVYWGGWLLPAVSVLSSSTRRAADKNRSSPEPPAVDVAPQALDCWDSLFPAFEGGVVYRGGWLLPAVSVLSSSTLRAADENRSSPEPPAEELCFSGGCGLMEVWEKLLGLMHLLIG